MGCADASELARAVWGVVRSHIDPRSRQEVACEFITTFIDQGLSGLEECTQLQEDRETNPDDVFDDWAPENDPFGNIIDAEFTCNYLDVEDEE